jgi:NTP pyrophosphatase (non-canonical NTP hydrolase)
MISYGIYTLNGVNQHITLVENILYKGVTRMNFNDYQDKAEATAIYKDKDKLLYTSLGLAGEAGEIANKVKKIIRDKDFEGNAVDSLTYTEKEALVHELGDVLWYVSAIASDLGFNLATVAIENLNKLQSRAERNKIGGSGDDR